ncbi:MAG: phosphatase PAP2 family protein, partial [Mycobacterium sp.]
GLLAWVAAGAAAFSIGRRRLWTVFADFLPFAAVLIAYDYLRGLSDKLGMPTWWQPQIDVDRFLFFGKEPTVWLQEHLKLPHPPWWEVVMSTVYMSFFILPYVVAGVLWLRNRNDWKAFVLRFVALQFLALIVYILLPAAPPWAAARCTADEVVSGPSDPKCMFHSARGVPDGGLLGAMSTSQPGAHQWVERISTRGWGTLHLDSARSLIDEGQATVNLVAAIPSLHAALTAMVSIFLWRRVRAIWRPLLVAYPLIMAFLLVYTAEHFVFDLLLGWAFAEIVLVVIGRLESRWAGGFTRWRFCRRRRYALNLAEQRADRTVDELIAAVCPNGESPVPADQEIRSLVSSAAEPYTNLDVPASSAFQPRERSRSASS